MKLKSVKSFIRSHFMLNDNYQFYDMLRNIKVRSSSDIIEGQKINIRIFQIPPKTSGLYFVDIVNNGSIAKRKIKFVRTLSAIFKIPQSSIIIKDTQKCKHKPKTKKKLRITFTTCDSYDGIKFAYQKLKIDGRFYYIKPVE